MAGLVALESYDSLYRKYPEMISAQVEKSINDQRKAIGTIPEAETKKALGTLTEAVSRTSETVAMRAIQASWLHACGFGMLCMLLFGTFCTFIGFVLGSARLPYWAQPSGQHTRRTVVLDAGAHPRWVDWRHCRGRVRGSRRVVLAGRNRPAPARRPGISQHFAGRDVAWISVALI